MRLWEFQNGCLKTDYIYTPVDHHPYPTYYWDVECYVKYDYQLYTIYMFDHLINDFQFGLVDLLQLLARSSPLALPGGPHRCLGSSSSACSSQSVILLLVPLLVSVAVPER